jgi:hypothetical protein
MMLSDTSRQLFSEYRDFPSVLLVASVGAGVLATFASIQRASGQASIVWLATAEVALLGTALLSKHHSRRRNWLVVCALSTIILSVGGLSLYLA